MLQWGVLLVMGKAATPRAAAYVWVTWLADVMTGVSCEWRYWFQAHNKLNESARVFDDPKWHLNHTALLSQLEEELTDQGMELDIEYEIKHPIDRKGSMLAGKTDCLSVDPHSNATVYDAKTGKPKPSHQVQVMLYIWCLSKRPRFRGMGLRGELVYPDHRESIRGLPEGFDDKVLHWLKKLTKEESPRKAPGQDCRYCPVTQLDCPERVEWVEGDLPPDDLEPLLD